MTGTSGITDWYAKGGLPVFTNLVGDVIDKYAVTFKKIPGLEIQGKGSADNNDAMTNEFKDILYKADAWETFKNNDRVAGFLKMGIVLVWYEKEISQYTFNLLHRGNCDVEYNGLTKQVISLLYETNCAAVNSGYTTYRYINNDVVVDFEARSSGDILNKVTNPNPFGFIPIAHCYDRGTPRSGFWPKGEPWADLVCMAEAVNVLDSTLVLSARWGILQALFTNMRMPENSTFSAGSVIELEPNPMSKDTPFAEFKGPDNNVSPFYDGLDKVIERLYNSYAVKVKAEGRANISSGFQLVVEEFPSLQMQEERQGYATPFMKRIFKVLCRMNSAANLGYNLPEHDKAELYITWPKPSIPVDEQGKWNIQKEKMAAKVMSPIDYLMEEDPTLTEEEAAAKIQAIYEMSKKMQEMFGLKSSLKTAFGVADNKDSGQAGNA